MLCLKDINGTHQGTTIVHGNLKAQKKIICAMNSRVATCESWKMIAMKEEKLDDLQNEMKSVGV